MHILWMHSWNTFCLECRTCFHVFTKLILPTMSVWAAISFHLLVANDSDLVIPSQTHDWWEIAISMLMYNCLCVLLCKQTISQCIS